MLQAWKAMTQKAGCLMDPDQERKHLAQADRHITEVKKHILRQRVLVQKAIKTGRPSAEAQSMLEALQASLRAFEKHRQLILLAIAEKRPLSPIQPPRPYDHSLAQAASIVRDRSDR